jgi:hypothetical protein
MSRPSIKPLRSGHGRPTTSVRRIPNDPASGFKNHGQFVAAVNQSNNHGLDFNVLKSLMVDGGLSLGQAKKQMKGMGPRPSTTSKPSTTSRRFVLARRRPTTTSKPPTTSRPDPARPRPSMTSKPSTTSRPFDPSGPKLSTTDVTKSNGRGKS